MAKERGLDDGLSFLAEDRRGVARTVLWRNRSVEARVDGGSADRRAKSHWRPWNTRCQSYLKGGGACV
jgi:hypothetical protein